MPRPRKITTQPKSPAPAATIEAAIHTIRGERVILDADLAKTYGVKTKVLNQAVKRNREKFPADFLFELTRREAVSLQHSRRQDDVILRSQIVTLKHGRHVKYLPFAFTEHGAIMAANILNSPQAVQMSVFVVRAFIKMRAALSLWHGRLAREFFCGIGVPPMMAALRVVHGRDARATFQAA